MNPRLQASLCYKTSLRRRCSVGPLFRGPPVKDPGPRSQRQQNPETAMPKLLIRSPRDRPVPAWRAHARVGEDTGTARRGDGHDQEAQPVVHSKTKRSSRCGIVQGSTMSGWLLFEHAYSAWSCNPSQEHLDRSTASSAVLV